MSSVANLCTAVTSKEKCPGWGPAAEGEKGIQSPTRLDGEERKGWREPAGLPGLLLGPWAACPPPATALSGAGHPPGEGRKGHPKASAGLQCTESLWLPRAKRRL